MTNKIVEFDEMKIILMKYNELCSNYSLDDNNRKKLKNIRTELQNSFTNMLIKQAT
mgnify:CR=1 FL=1